MHSILGLSFYCSVDGVFQVIVIVAISISNKSSMLLLLVFQPQIKLLINSICVLCFRFYSSLQPTILLSLFSVFSLSFYLSFYHSLQFSFEQSIRREIKLDFCLYFRQIEKLHTQRRIGFSSNIHIHVCNWRFAYSQKSYICCFKQSPTLPYNIIIYISLLA